MRARFSFCLGREFCVNWRAKRLDRYVSPRVDARMDALRRTVATLGGGDTVLLPFSSTTLILHFLKIIWIFEKNWKSFWIKKKYLGGLVLRQSGKSQKPWSLPKFSPSSIVSGRMAPKVSGSIRPTAAPMRAKTPKMVSGRMRLNRAWWKTKFRWNIFFFFCVK